MPKQEGIKEEIKTQEEKVNEDVAKEKAPKKRIPSRSSFPIWSRCRNPLPVEADPKPQARQGNSRMRPTLRRMPNWPKKQADLAFDTKDIANLLKPVAKDAAKKVENAEKSMKSAKEEPSQERAE